jgi:hypothetical protein
LARKAICVVARFEATRAALRELYPSRAEEALAIGGATVPLFCIPNVGRNAPSHSFVRKLGEEAAQQLRPLA